MRTQILIALGAAAALCLTACGDDETGGSGGSGNTGNTGNTGNAGGGTGNSGNDGGGGAGNSGNAGGGGGGTPTCEEVCGILYECGSADDFALCPGFEEIPEQDFVDGCVPGCETNPALAAIVDPDNCAGTIGIVSGANPDFETACQDGAGGGGGGN